MENTDESSKEDSRHSVSESESADLDIKAATEQVCQGLCIPGSVRECAIQRWNNLVRHHPDIQEGTTIHWMACLLYSASIEERYPYGTSAPEAQNGVLSDPYFTVTDLLRKTELPLKTFCQKLEALHQLSAPSAAVDQHCKALQRKYCITTYLYNRFERMYKEIFHVEDQQGLEGESGADSSGSLVDNQKFIWTLFLISKGALLETAQLVTALHILLCCFEYVMKTTPLFQLQSPYDEARFSSEVNTPESDMLLQLCNAYRADIEDVRSVQSSFFQPLVASLSQSTGSIELRQLEDLYLEQYRKSGDINELDFMSHDPLLSPSADSNSSEKNPGQNPTVMTPVRMAQNTVQQLKQYVQNTRDEPSDKLCSLVKCCETDPVPVMTSQVTQMKGAFVTHFIAILGERFREVSQRHFTLATRLYYTVMESMLQQEQELSPSSPVSSWLSNTTFHRCLVACCVEVVLHAHEVSLSDDQMYPAEDQDFSFPWVLHIFDLQPFDFFRVVEVSIKMQTGLGLNIIKHLQAVEHKILERVAWQSGSSLYDMITAFPELGNRDVNLSPSSGPQLPADHSSANLLQSPLNPRKQSVQIPSGLSARPQRSRSLNIFFKKVYSLAYNRLQALCKLLGVSKDLQQKVWYCIEYCLTKKPLLMKDRHLDQILMCCLYPVCKVTEKDVEREVKFKTIIAAYKKLPHIQPQTFKQVYIRPNEYDTIIKFYNKIFMQNIKDFVGQFSVGKETGSSDSPGQQMAAPATGSPVYSLPGKNNFYISPMKESPFKVASPSQMTPKSRQLYNFGEGIGSADKLRNINEAVRAHKRKSDGDYVIKGKKRLQYHLKDDNSDSINMSDVIVVKRTAQTTPKKPSWSS